MSVNTQQQIPKDISYCSLWETAKSTTKSTKNFELEKIFLFYTTFNINLFWNSFFFEEYSVSEELLSTFKLFLS